MSNQNPFVIETALIEHLTMQIPDLLDVGSFAKYEAQVAGQDYPPLPSVYIMPDESEVSDNGDDFQVETQAWIISILVDHSPDILDVDTTATKAGVIMADVMSALIGWRPSLGGSTLQGFKTMRYAGRGTPIYAPGFGEFPVLFTTGLVLTGNN